MLWPRYDSPNSSVDGFEIDKNKSFSAFFLFYSLSSTKFSWTIEKLFFSDTTSKPNSSRIYCSAWRIYRFETWESMAPMIDLMEGKWISLIFAAKSKQIALKSSWLYFIYPLRPINLIR